MLCRLLALLVLVCYGVVCAELPVPDRAPAGPTPQQVALIGEGIALTDQHRFVEAIAKYRRVLDQNPWEVHALYELAATYLVAKDYGSALGTARLGAQCDSPRLSGFYDIMADSLEHLGHPKEAIAVRIASDKLYARARPSVDGR